MTKPAAVDPLQATPSRRVASRVLGPLLPYLLHLRPAEWPILGGHLATAWLLAAGLRWPTWPEFVAMLAWVVGLNGGTLALNSAFDRDEEDIAYLKQPPLPPRGLASLALVLMLAGLAITWWLGTTWRALYIVCIVMSIAYSVPPLRLKRMAGVDWMINVIGFGLITGWAGWTISGRTLDRESFLLLAGFAPLFGALYPLTQLYQLDADRRRGDRTLAVWLGVRRSVALALLQVGIAFAMFVAAAWLADWGSVPGLRFAALAIALMGWLAVLLPWHRDGFGWASRQHQRAMYHALAAWAITDAAILIAWAV